MDEISVDGYGSPFPPEAQERHLLAVLACIHAPKEPPKKEPEQVEWKDKPAGHFERGSGI